MITIRCGVCEACKFVESTKRLVLAQSAPAGPGITQKETDMWNKCLEENPCKARVDQDYTTKVIVIPRPPTELEEEENVQRFIARMRNDGWLFDGAKTNSFNIHLTFKRPN
jgi:hypothetical protein